MGGSWSTRENKVKLESGSLSLTLEREAEVRVRVRDGNGDPVSHYRLLATLDGSSGMFGLGATRASERVDESEDGVGTLTGLTPGDWSLDVRADGFADPEPVAFAIPRSEDPIDVTLLPTATVS